MNQADEVRKCSICRCNYWINELSFLQTENASYPVCDDCSNGNNAFADIPRHKDSLSKTGAIAILKTKVEVMKNISEEIKDLLEMISKFE